MRRLPVRRDRVYLAAATLVPFALDILLTSLGQPASYWSGERGTLIEANPVAASLLAVHPALFLGGALCYAIIFTAGLYLLPRPIAWWLSIALILAHAGGARSWLWHFTAHYTFWEGILNGSMAVLVAACFLKAARRAHETESAAARPAT
jgi:hypothetical protein